MGPFWPFQAHRHGVSIDPRAPGRPHVSIASGLGLEDEQLAFLRAGGWEANIVVGIRPVEANAGGKVLWRSTLHVSTSQSMRKWYEGTCLLAFCAGMIESR